MRKKAEEAIRKFHMFPKGAEIVVGLSGGADSVALLQVLCSLQEKYNWYITAVHIHHGLRGEDADKDRDFAEDFCGKLGVPCIVKQYDVKAEARKRKLGEEETGRLLRYEAFREIAGKDGFIAVAHHRKDQAETILMRLCRGTGLTGLVGMSPVRGNICRPLLFCSREEIERYCKENGLNWREDATNLEDIYTRNKLRLRVLPLLEEINPRAEEHIARTAELLSAEEDYMVQQAAACYSAAKRNCPEGEVHLEREGLRALHPAMKKRVLRMALAEFLSADISLAQLEALEDLLEKESGKGRDLLGGILAENRYDVLVLSRKKEKLEGYCYALPLGERVYIPEQDVFITAGLERLENAEAFDLDKIEGELSCRTRKTGDIIALKAGRRKIKNLFIDEKIPRKERDSLPLITVGQEVLWAVGLRVSEKYSADENTKQVLYIVIEGA